MGMQHKYKFGPHLTAHHAVLKKIIARATARERELAEDVKLKQQQLRHSHEKVLDIAPLKTFCITGSNVVAVLGTDKVVLKKGPFNGFVTSLTQICDAGGKARKYLWHPEGLIDYQTHRNAVCKYNQANAAH